jgi:hypothetical protein
VAAKLQMSTSGHNECLTSQEVSGCARRAKAVICETTARLCREAFGNSLRAIVLTGSLARDEATFVEEGASCRLLGDADVFLVFDRTSKVPLPVRIASITAEIETALRLQDIHGAVSLAAVDAAYLRGLPRHIASYELRSCGEVIAGEAGILSLAPAFAPADIALEDAWRLLANRTIELLEIVAAEGDVERTVVQYRVIKLFLDMATSYLVFTGRYSPTYGSRAQTLSIMAAAVDGSANSSFPLQAFAELVSACTTAKLEGCGVNMPPRELWHNAVRFGGLLWRWELEQLTGASGHLDASELMSRWMKQQPLKAKLRGWASLLRRSGWLRSCRHWPRWALLARRGSPRYCVYAVAAGVFASNLSRQQNQQNVNCKSLLNGLPLADLRSSEPSWQATAQLVATNYRRYLETTTA